MSTAIDLAGALHEAVLHSAPDELAERLVPRMLPLLAEGSPVVAVLDDTIRAEVRRALGDAAEHVEFPDPAVVHRVPPFTVATRWARPSRRVATATGRATVVGQHLEGLPGCGENHWARLDIALNVAVVGLPITVLCPYRADDRERARVEATHPRLRRPPVSVASGDVSPATEALGARPPPLPSRLPAAELTFTGDELADLRHLVAEVAGRGATASDRVADMVLAVNEIGSNSVEHGPGRGRLRLWTTDEAVIAEIADPPGNRGPALPRHGRAVGIGRPRARPVAGLGAVRRHAGVERRPGHRGPAADGSRAGRLTRALR